MTRQTCQKGIQNKVWRKIGLVYHHKGKSTDFIIKTMSSLVVLELYLLCELCNLSLHLHIPGLYQYLIALRAWVYE